MTTQPMTPTTETPESRHTPGPLTVQVDQQHGDDFATILIRGYNRNGEREFTIARLTGCENAEENAPILALAPELLEALKRAEKKLETAMQHFGCDPCHLTEEVESISNLLARAGGTK